MSSKKKGTIAKGKKKNAVARAVIRKGKGTIRINSRNIDTIEPEYIRAFIVEPIEMADSLGKEVDIDVTVNGGGFIGQSVASRTAIAKVLLEYKSDEKLKKKFLAYDRMLLVDDARRVEPKKQLGPKARSKKQKSKR